MAGTGGARKYELLSSWDKSFNDLFEADLKERPFQQHSIRAEAQRPVILVRVPCFPWTKLQVHSESHEATHNLQGYSKPAAWKRIFRKLRAEARKIQLSCCEGLCLPSEIPDYTSHSYHKNFDDGRQCYWQQHSSTLRLSSYSYTAPLRSEAHARLQQKPRMSSINSRSYVSEFRMQVDPLRQKGSLVSLLKLE